MGQHASVMERETTQPPARVTGRAPLLDILTERGTAARTAAGWHECLDRLACELAGQPVPFAAGERWAEVHPGYVAAFGPGGSAIGPPPGYEPTARRGRG